MVFPNSNLSSGSVPWGREVQKRIELTDSKLTSLSINDRSDTKQLQDSYRRLDQTVQGLKEADVLINDALILAQTAADDAQAAADDAQAAIDDVTGVKTNIYVTGTTSINGGKIQTGTVDANKLKATDSITLTNSTGSEYVKFGHQNWGSGTSQPGTVGGNTTNGDTYFVGPWTGSGGAYGSSQRGVTVGSIYSGSVGPSLQLYTQTSPSFSYNAKLTDGIGYLQLQSGSVYLNGDYSSLNAGSASINVTSVTSSASIYAPSGTVSITGSSISISGSSISISGTISSALNVSSTINYAGGTTSGNIKYNGYAALASGTTLVLGSSATGYTIGIVTSSRRFKENIQPIENISYVDKISLLTPVTFNFKGNPSEISFGLIAEDVNDLGFTGMVNNDLDEDGKSVPFSLMYDRLAVYMIPAIKELNERIKLLEGK